MIKLSSFLKKNKSKIVNIGRQENYDPINPGYYEPGYKKFKVVEEISRKYPENTMVFREQIIDELRTNLYRGIVLMFIWGQLDWKRPKKYCPGDKTTTCFYRFLSMSERTVVNNLEETRILIRQDRVEELFKEYSKTPKFSGKYKLEGVDYAYFTKIFFLGQIDEKVKVKPLILDKWTRTAFCALINEIEGPEFVKSSTEFPRTKMVLLLVWI